MQFCRSSEDGRAIRLLPPLFFEDEFAELDAELAIRIRASLEYLGEAILRTKN
jgi:hypothetical protein